MNIAGDMQQSPQPRAQLVQARLRLKLSQRQVAERIGTTHVNVSRWERGITKPGPYFQRRLVQLYGRTEEELDLAQPPTESSPIPSAFSPTSTTAIASAAPIIDPSIPLLSANPLVGRDDMLTQLKQRLSFGGTVMLTALNGLPGVGKTTLAIAIARDAEVQARFRDGILWAGLGPQPNMFGIMSHWGGLLGIPQAEIGALADAEAWAITLRRAIGLRQMLLVIDDAWSERDALALKVGGPNCAHLITTRSPAIANQLGAAITIHELGEAESVMLLRILAPPLMERDEQRARELAQAVGGLPLALTLVGNYLRRNAYSGQPRRVEAALSRLSDAVERLHISEPRAPAERHPSLPLDMPVSLQSVIAVTDAQLDAKQQAALRALAVFPPKPDSFLEGAALYVADCSPETLDFLADAGLLEYGEGNHYTMHQTIADYARAHLDNDTPYARLAEHMADFVQSHRKDYTLLEQESSAILAALEAAHTLGKSDALMRCIYAYIPYLRSRGQYSLAEKHLRRALVAADNTGDGYGKAGALLYLGEIAQKQGNYEQATSSLHEGLELARQVGDTERITALLAVLGWVMWKRGEYAQAEVLLQEGLILAREIDDKEHISYILETLGSVAASRGEYNTSMEYMEEALEVARETDDQEKKCTLLINMGVTEGDHGNYKQAETHFLEALQIAQQIGHREWMSLLYSNLGNAEGELANYVQAETYFREGLKVAREINHREWISALLSSLGQITRKQGLYDQASAYLQESLLIAKQINRPKILSEALDAYGNLYLDRRQADTAERIFQEMLAVIPEGSKDLFGLAQFGLARAVAAQGRIAEAQVSGKLSLDLFESVGHPAATEVRQWLYLLSDST